MCRVFLHVRGTFLLAELRGIFAGDEAPGGKNLTCSQTFHSGQKHPLLILDYWTQLFCMLPLHPQHKAHPNGLYKAKNYISWSYIPVSIWGDLKTNSLCEWVIQHGHNIIENIDNWKNGIKIIKITSLIDKPLAVKISFSFSASIFLALCTFSSSASAILCSLSFSLVAFLSL